MFLDNIEWDGFLLFLVILLIIIFVIILFILLIIAAIINVSVFSFQNWVNATLMG